MNDSKLLTTDSSVSSLLVAKSSRDISLADVTIEVRPESEATAIMYEWRLLDHRINDGSVSCSWDWVQTWLDHYGNLVPHRFAVGRRGDQVCGLCLLTEGVGRRVGPFPLKSLHVGTAGEPDADSVCVQYNRMLVEASCRSAFARGLVEFIDAEPAWDEFCLDGFAVDDFDSFFAGAALFERNEVASFFFDLKAAREASVDAISRLGNSTRKRIRKNLKAYDPLKTEWAESSEQADAIFDDLVHLHQARWIAVGQPGVFASERFLNFHRSLIHKLLPQGKIGLFRVTRGDEVIGCIQLFVDRNRALVYQAGSAPYGGKQSPGVVVDILCIEECLRRGFDAYDFLKGDSGHKRNLSTDCHRLIWAKRRRPRLKFLLTDAARSIRRTVRGFRGAQRG